MSISATGAGFIRERNEECIPSILRHHRARTSILLNQEVCVNIISFLDLSNVGKIAKVCKDFHKAVDTPLLWKNFAKRISIPDSESFLSKPRNISWKENFELFSLEKKWNQGYRQGLEEGRQLVKIEIAIYLLALTAWYAYRAVIPPLDYDRDWRLKREDTDYPHTITTILMLYKSILGLDEELNSSKAVKVYIFLITHIIVMGACDSLEDNRNPCLESSFEKSNYTFRSMSMSELLAEFLLIRCIACVGKKFLEMRSSAISCAVRTLGYRLFYHLRYSKPFRMATLGCLTIAIINSQILTDDSSKKIKNGIIFNSLVFVGCNILIPTTIVLGKEVLKQERTEGLCRKITKIPQVVWKGISQCFIKIRKRDK